MSFMKFPLQGSCDKIRVTDGKLERRERIIVVKIQQGIKNTQWNE